MKQYLHFQRIVFIFGLLAVATGVAAPTPVVFKVSQGVRSHSVLSLYGEYLTGALQVRFRRPDGSVAATQPAVQTDPAGHFCRVIFPAVPPGAYELSVSNEAGWSTRPVYVNRPEPRWLSEERGYPGLAVKLIGRNLDAEEYSGLRRTQVRLVPVNGGTSTVISPDAINPYCVDFSIPRNLPTGGYHVEVNAHSAAFGEGWARLDNHSEFPDVVSDTVVQVETAPANPTALALKVAWANDFNWRSTTDIRRDFDAKGDGVADDTLAIQRAINRVADNGGGVVYLPKGTYRVSGLTLPAKCVLQGENRESTVIMVAKTTDQGAITAKSSLHGISTLTLKFQPTVPASNPGMLLGGVAERLFLHNVGFDLLRDPDVSAKQGPYYVSGSGPILVAGCQFFISSRNLWNHQVRNRVIFRNNFVDMHDGLGLCMSSEKLLVLENDLAFHPAPYAGQMNGFFLNEGWMGWNIYNAYIAGNNAHDLNGPGDCQPYAADSAWSCLAGGVLAAGANFLEVRADLLSDFKGLDTHELEIIVVQGRGLGQLRRVSAHRNLGGDPAVIHFTVSPAWEVPPDTTSLVSIGCWHVNNVFFGNRAEGSKSPYNMYYGGCYDCVDAEAVSRNTEGWYNWGRIGEFPENRWHCPVYFSQLRRSSFSGVSPTYSTMGITLRVENETKTYRGIADYGTEIRDNTIDRGACSNRNQRLAGNAAIATFNHSWMKVSAETPLLFATLCEGNIIKNSAMGFDLNGSFAFAIRGTKYENCPKAVNDNGYETAILPGSPDPLGAATPAGAHLAEPAEPPTAGATGSAVRILKQGGKCLLQRNGQPYFVKGAVVGPGGSLEMLQAAGANSIRTHAGMLDEAQWHGLTALVGLPLGNPRQGFDYADTNKVEAQFNRACELVRKYRHHPALLFWSLGNEPEIHTTPEQRVPVWKEANRLAEMVKQEDPDHPVMVVIGGQYADMLHELNEYCPALDLVGLNSYAQMLKLREEIAKQGWTRPYVVTEFGPRGHWQVPKTPWKVPIEDDANSKAEFYLRAYQHSVSGQAACLGSYVFYWAHKQEKTHTWYGMFLPDGSRTPAIDTMTFLWTGQRPTNRCPVLSGQKLTVAPADGSTPANPGVFPAGTKLACAVEVSDPENNPLRITWELRPDVADNTNVGGDWEPSVEPVKDAVVSIIEGGRQAVMQLPAKPGKYRVFVYVYDGHGNATTANVPLLTE